MGQFIVNEINLIRHNDTTYIQEWHVLRSGEAIFRSNATWSNKAEFLAASNIVSDISIDGSAGFYITIEKSGYYMITNTGQNPQSVSYYDVGARVYSYRASGNISYIIYFGDSNPFE